MSARDDISVTRRLTIPAAELDWRFSRSGGPGGQHANTSDTQVELRWNVLESTALSNGQRRMILERLAEQLDKDGALRVVSSERRSQHQNRSDAKEKLAKLVAGALAPRKKRKRTRPTKASEERRLRKKKRRSEKKRLRKPPPIPEI